LPGTGRLSRLLLTSSKNRGILYIRTAPISSICATKMMKFSRKLLFLPNYTLQTLCKILRLLSRTLAACCFEAAKIA
jgi:hypothetical protein